MRFGVRPEPYEQEDIYGYLMRVMYLNGVSTPSSLVSEELDLVKINQKFGSWSINEIHNYTPGLSQLTGRTEYQISSLWNKSHAPWIYNSQREIRSLRIKSPRVCLSCISENGFFHSAWSYVTSTSCDIHNEELLHECPHCSVTFTWNTALFDRCSHCKLEWRSLSSTEREMKPCRSEQRFSQLSEIEKLQASNSFAKSLLRVVRPLDTDPFQIVEFDALTISSIQIKAAYQLWNNPAARQIHRENYLAHWMPISPLVAYQYQEISLPSISNIDHENSVSLGELSTFASDQVLKPAIKKLVSNSLPSWAIVSPYIFARTLGIRKSDLHALSEKGLVQSIKTTELVRDTLYDIRCAEKLVRRVGYLSCDNYHFENMVEVMPSDKMFENHLTQFGYLLADLILHNVNGYRCSENLESIYIEKNELNSWLIAKLEMNCRSSIPIQKAKKVAGRLFRKTPFDDLVINGDIKAVQRPNGKIEIDGPTFFDFITSKR